MFDYVWLVPLFPLLGFLANILFGRRVGKTSVSWIACGTVGFSFVSSAKILVDLLGLPMGERLVQRVIFPWILSGSFSVDVGFQIDPLSAVMVLVVSGVGFLIHIYSVGYMAKDPAYSRYFAYLNLFTFSMLTLVLANNFLLMYVGWEAVGLCSYLLIGFWFEKKSAADAGKKAFIVNRVGDFGFALGIFLIFWTFGSLNFSHVFNAASDNLAVGSPLATAITLLLFMGATGKSAQIPLYVWLPDAMEGPTPVSALIHAATMVTAGVYMVARCSALYLLAPVSLSLVAVIGIATAIYSASIALVQKDIKRVLAYSTISQLGYMFLACGVGAFTAGIFHLVTHAFFKALLFLGAGSVIHALSGEQDLTKMGGLRKRIPITFWTFLAGTLAISGIPGLSGFFSKDEILWEAFSTGHTLLWIIGVITAGMTAFYMFRLLYLAFFGEPRFSLEVERHVHESPKSMTVPLVGLAVLSVIGGYIGIPHSLGGRGHFSQFLSEVFVSKHQAETAQHFPPSSEYLVMAVSIVVVLIGIFLAYRLYVKNPQLTGRWGEKLKGVYAILSNKYYVDEIYSAIFVRPIVKLATFLWQVFDVRVIDGIANGSAYVVGWLGGKARRLHTGFFRNYALSLFLGAIIILGYLILKLR